MDEFARLNEEEMTVDVEYVDMLHDRVANDNEKKKKVKL